MFYRLLSEKWRPQDNDMETENDIALRRPSSTFRFLTQLYTPIATTFVCILLLLNLNQWHHSHKSWATPRIGQQDQEVIETIFTGSDKWESLDPKYDALWDQYGSGAEIMVKDMEVEQEDMIPASISMVHQLHCLGAFRKAIRDAKPLEGHKIDHLTHCLDYVRMGITCCADSTVEVPYVENGHRVGFINGAKTAHQCRSISPIIELQERLGPADPDWSPWKPNDL